MISETHEAVPTPIKHTIWTGDNIDEIMEMTGGFYDLKVSYPSKRLNAGDQILAHVGYYVALHTLANGQWRLSGYAPEEFQKMFRKRT